MHFEAGAVAPMISISQYRGDDEDPYAPAGPQSSRNRAASFLMLS